MLFGILMIFTTCENIFNFSAYMANVKEEDKNTTAKNLQLIEDLQSESKDFKFAFVTDTHFFYDNLKTVLDDINKKEDVLFVIFGGDYSAQGLLKEYEIFYDILKTLKKPFVTVIGNHDYNSNGGIIYKEMFGAFNYSFKFNDNKFVLFDNVVWESNKIPDFDWLSSELSNNALFSQVFVIAHIPPSDNQFTDAMEQNYTSLMSENNVPLSIHGHTHGYSYEKPYGDGVNYLTVPSLKKPKYCIIHVKDNSFEIELIKL
ncbi:MULTISPECIES: metallophosphoesterase family protein [unclassified Polaribacter]|uniref:metallophosphoesterase family protein n=1 Tax=unclassified Polaribacter TaxID=196858 RepID=UPI00167A93F8|nr:MULTISPECIES: metallophosphoesterase [unclassified Polaribacter]